MADTTESAVEEREYSETEIAVPWREEEYVPPHEGFKEQVRAWVTEAGIDLTRRNLRARTTTDALIAHGL